jgi:hypothetical protein
MTRAAQIKADATATGTHRWMNGSNTVSYARVCSVALLQSVPLRSAYRLASTAALILPLILADALLTFNRSLFGAMLRAIPLRSRFREYEYSQDNGRVRVNQWPASEVVKVGFRSRLCTGEV